MDTKSYIKAIRSKGRKPEMITLRGAVYLFLISQNVSYEKIGKIFGCTRRNIYYSVEKMRDYMSTNDMYAKDAMLECEQHNITIRPKSVRQNSGLLKVVGYEMLVDNEIFKLYGQH